MPSTGAVQKKATEEEPPGKNRKKRSRAAGINKGKKLQCFLQPKVLVIDDSPFPLVRSIERWIEDQFAFSADFQLVTEAKSFREIEELLPLTDFVLLDHRINDNFGGFKTGVEIGISIKKLRKELPIAYYTGYPKDLEKAGIDSKIKLLNSFGDVRHFEKSMLKPDSRSLDELCHSITYSASRATTSTTGSELSAVRALSGAHIEAVTEYLYRIEHFDRRRSKQAIRCFSNMAMSEIEVPTEHLKNIGISDSGDEVWLKVVRFDGGQVLSYLAKADVSFDNFADDVLEMLESKSL